MTTPFPSSQLSNSSVYVKDPNQPFQHKFLQPNYRNSANFLEEISYHINLQNLYLMRDTCTYHEDMEYCPILLEIGPQLVERYQGFRYILQVWTKSQELVYERFLKDEINVWAICFKYFLYKGESLDGKDSQNFFVVNLSNGNSTFILNDTWNDPSVKFVSYNDNIIYIANQKEIRVTILEDNLKAGEVRELEIQKDQFACIPTDDEHTIHAIYLDKAGAGIPVPPPGAGRGAGARGAAAKPNNQALGQKPGEQGFGQGQGQRKGPGGPGGPGAQDQAQRYVYVVIETEDNQIDLNKLILQKKPENGQVQYQFRQFKEIQPRSDKFDPIVEFSYTVRLGIASREFQFGIARRKSGKADLYCNGNNASTIDLPYPVQNIACTFDETYFMINKEIRGVDHNLNSRISYEESAVKPGFDFGRLFYQKIKGHCKLYNSFVFMKTNIFVAHGNIVSFFNVVDQKWIGHIQFDSKIDKIFRQLDDKGSYEIVVITQDGKLQFINTRNAGQSARRNDENNFSLDNELAYKLEGKITVVNYDRDTTKWSIVQTQENGAIKLQALYQRKLYDISDNVQGLTPKSNIVFLFAPSDKGEFLVQNEKEVTLYEIEMGKEQPQVNNLFSTVINDIQPNYKIHSGLRCREGEIMIIMDQVNFYKITLKENSIYTFKDQKCVGIFLIDDNYLYTLCRQQKEAKNNYAGFRLYDIQNLIERNSSFSYMLKGCQVGCQGDMDYSHDNHRLLFQQNFNKLFVVPLLHRTTISMMGMLNRDQYLATKVIYDKFIALSKRNEITTWDILTGKILKVHKLDESQQDFSKYDIFQYDEQSIVYKREWYSKILIRCKQPLESFDENQFLEDYQVQQQVKNQVTFMKGLKLKFYDHKLIEIINETEVVEHLNFTHPLLDRQLMNHFIYFNENADLMIERSQWSKIIMYQRIQVPGSKKVTWQKVLKFSTFPLDLLRTTQNMFILSPDFTQYIDVDRQNHQFMIRDTLTKNELYKIPKWLMDCENEPFQRVIQRFKWIDNSHFRIINQEGIERVIDVQNEFSEVEFNVIQLYDKNECEKNQLFFDPEYYPLEDTIRRLQKKYNSYKSAFFLFKESNPHVLNQILFSVDYNLDGTKGNYVSDLSFSFLHWNIIEQLNSGILEIDEVDPQQIQKIIYNILPNGDTFLHMLASKGEIIERILSLAHNLETKEIKFHLPFLINFDGLSPMNIFNDKNDFRIMDITLSYLSLYGVDHHSRAIQDALPIFIQHQIPSFGMYLDSRLLQTSQISKIKKSTLRETEHTGMVVSSFWVREETIDELLTVSPIEQDLRLEFIDIPNIHTLRQKHKYSKIDIAQEFFKSLSETTDINLFTQKVIKRILEYKWPIVREYILKKLFVPYFFFMVTYLTYANIIYLNRLTSTTFKSLDILFQILITLFALYFLRNEVRQLKIQGFAYFGSIWNYLDFTPPILVILFIPFEQLGFFDGDEHDTLEASLQATMTLLFWLKFLYFLRIFDSTGYLIRIIIEVVYDMRHFMLVLLLTFIAFGDAMMSISTSNTDENDQFINGYINAVKYIYLMVLGNFEFEFGKVAVPYVWILFILCTVFNMIIMFNLLIAIISESFARINEVSQQASYQEKCGLIAENVYLVSNSSRNEFGKMNQYLLIATDINEEARECEKSIEDNVKDVIQSVQSRMNEVESNLGNRINSLQSTVDELKVLLVEALKKE